MIRRIIYVVIAITIGLTPVVHLNAQTIEPQYDMYTDPDHTGSHPVTELWVANYAPMSNHQRIMIMFNLEPYMGGAIDSAFLNLDRFFGCPHGDPTHTKIYEITEPWDESWPENVHISHGGTEWASYTFSYNGWHEIDITSLVNEWLDGTITNYGLVIQALAGNKWSKFYSREASSSVRPYLELFGYSGVEEKNETVTQTLKVEMGLNPFFSTCRIVVPEGTLVEIFRVDGRRVYRIQNTGSELIWKPSESIGSGIYFIYATRGEQSAVGRLIYLKR